jgi:alpha-amylase
MIESFRPVAWAHSTNIYEVNVRQYTAEGTFAAFAKELPRLKKMSVQVIWFMPITPIAELNRKGALGSYYACSDYNAINPEFGTLEDFRSLVKQAHDLGFKVIIDWVANHTGWGHTWTYTHPEFFAKSEGGGFRPTYAEWDDTIALDYNNKQLRRSMIDAMKFWLTECDLDGFRCDMAHLVPLDFWKEARTELDAIKPLFWLAETEDVRYHEAFDASYAWKFLHTMEKYWRKEIGMPELEAVLTEYDKTFPATALRAYFTSNHDENSHSGSEYERMGEAAVPFAVLCATWNCIPLVYSGQEMPMINKRLHFFDKDAIPWTGEYGLNHMYKTLLCLRMNNPALRAGDSTIKTHRLKTNDDSKIFSYLRRKDEKEVLVILNLSSDTLQVEINDSNVNGVYVDVFTAMANDFAEKISVKLGKWEYRVFEK